MALFGNKGKAETNAAGSDAWLLVGLGNPGTKYARTWHNCGFLALDYLAERYGIKVNKLRFKGVYGQGQIEGKKVYLLKPETYMNNSGESVRQAMDYLKIPPERVAVFYDDIDIDLGQMRIREKGGAGSHNGMKSLLQHMGSRDFPRYRIGIGPQPKEQDIISYVLAAIPQTAKPLLKEALDRLVEGVSYMLAADIQLAMNRVNTNGKQKAGVKPDAPSEKQAKEPN